jgi:non-homologous end joining protein Ku
MYRRPVWSGAISFGLAIIPIKVLSASGLDGAP